MHETGHDYGCADSYGDHYDVMDYVWAWYPQYSWQFDTYHRGIIGPNRGLHSD